LGVSDETIKNMTAKLGDLSAEKVGPATKQEELLRELENVGSWDEQKVLATLIFKLVQ
jgi:hypothetical protein